MKIPNLSLGEFGYEGTIELWAWDKFLANSNGVYSIDVGGDMVVDDPKITKEHIEAYNYAIENQENIRDSIIMVLIEKYPQLQSEYGFEEDELEEIMSAVTDKEDFKNLIGLSKVHIMNVFKSGIAYTGYEFTCAWDVEHGLGFMMYQNKVIAIGGADMSFLTWVAEEDLEN